MGGIVVDGVDLEDQVGLVVQSDLEGWRNSLARLHGSRGRPERIGEVRLTDAPRADGRRLVVRGYQRAADVSTLLARRDELLWRLDGANDVEVSFADELNRRFVARLAGKVKIEGRQPSLSAVKHDVEIPLLCEDPRAYAVDETLVVVGEDGVDAPVDAAPLRLGGKGMPFTGTGEENLLRDAAMDTDTDGDGVVDGFQKFRDEGTGWSFSLFATGGAQQFTADGTGSSGERASVEQFVLRVFPGDEVVGSVDGFLTSGSTDLEGRLFLQFEKSDGSSIAGAPVTTWTDTTSQRRVVTTTAPAEAARVRFIVGARLTADSGSGDARVRDARLLRAASDPATWANPHVSGASQTGSALDTSGWPASESNVVREGDWIQPGGAGATQADAEGELTGTLRATADVDADANGDATIPVERGRLPLGTAPVRPSVEVDAASFTLEYRASDGTVLKSLEVSGASATPVTVDMADETITSSNGSEMDALASGWFFALDPHDGDYPASEWPRLVVTGADADLTYRLSFH